MPKPLTKADKKAACEAWYLAEIDKGLEDIEAGRVLTNEEAEAHMAAVFAELEANVAANLKLVEIGRCEIGFSCF